MHEIYTASQTHVGRGAKFFFSLAMLESTVYVKGVEFFAIFFWIIVKENIYI